MGKKKRTRFQMIREDVEGTPREVGIRPDRGAERAETQKLGDLANRLAALDKGELARLPLGEDLAHEIEVLAKIGITRARPRQVRRVAQYIRDVGADTILGALDGDSPADIRAAELERWRRRILSEGDAAIQDFLDTHEGADRQELRGLVRQARLPEGAEPTPASKRGYKKLFQVLKAATPLPPSEEEEEEG